jgi:Fur family transcriptional regulator, ferric uptake regulator
VDKDKKYKLEDVFREKGFKLTAPRRKILSLLENQTKPFSAQEFYEQMTEKEIDFSTVYRNLEALADKDIICRIIREDGTCSYELSDQEHHHHHLICTKCGNSQSINFCPMEIIDTSAWKGFTPIKHRFEVMGICGECTGGK